ncbi:MAG: molybdopterin-binding oxidoreductase [Halobacteriota archaeon]
MSRPIEAGPGPTRVAGSVQLVPDGDALVERARDGALSLETEAIAFRCHSGRRIDGHWTGLPVRRLLAGAPPSTTHLLVEGREGYRACVAVVEVMDGLVAVEATREGAPVPGDELPRLVADGLEAPRSVRGVTRVDAIALESGADPEALERGRR